MRNPGIVDYTVNTPEFGYRRVDEFTTLFGVGDVSGNDEAGLADHADRLSGDLEICAAAACDDNIGFGFGQSTRKAGSQPAPRAGDYCHPPCQPK